MCKNNKREKLQILLVRSSDFSLFSRALTEALIWSASVSFFCSSSLYKMQQSDWWWSAGGGSATPTDPPTALACVSACSLHPRLQMGCLNTVRSFTQVHGMQTRTDTLMWQLWAAREDRDRRLGTGAGGTWLTLCIQLMQFRSEVTPLPFCVQKSV